MTTPSNARRHDIDALRVIAFGLLILYHVGMVYVDDWGFHIKSPHQWEWLQWPMVLHTMESSSGGSSCHPSVEVAHQVLGVLLDVAG